MSSRLEIFREPKEVNRELFDLDVRRVLRVGWLILALSNAVAILSLPGPTQRWQLTAVAIIVIVSAISLAIDLVKQTSAAYLLMPLTLLALPIIFGSVSQEPWVAYGLLIIPAVLYSTIFNDYRISLGLIYFLTVLQYTVSKLEVKSLSDNVDNQLLSSYFSTSWTLICGIGAILIRRAYLNFYDAIEDSVNKMLQLESRETQKFSELNLKDHLNSQLHGTILNTLIAIKNTPALIKNKKEVIEYLTEDLKRLNTEESTKESELLGFIDQDNSLAIHRPVEVQISLNMPGKIDPLIYQVIKEIVRETVLNIKKHSNATRCSIDIQMKRNPIADGLDLRITERVLVITTTDNSVLNESERDKDSFHSESIARILRRVDGQISVSRIATGLSQKIVFTYPESYRTYLENIKKLRRESIAYLTKGYIFLSLFYSVISLPGFLLIGVNSKVALLYLIQIILIGLSFTFQRFEKQLSASGSLVAISIFPFLAFTQPLICTDLQYLPWIFNSLLGSVFYVTLVIDSKWLKWIPMFLFLFANLAIQNQLPTACEKLLDGSIPGIILIAMISLGFTISKNNTKRIEQNFIARSKGLFNSFEATSAEIERERSDVIGELKEFVDKLSQKPYLLTDIQREIEILIMKIRTFLLASEYFNSPVVLFVYRLAKERGKNGEATSLVINTNNFETGLSNRELKSIIDRVAEVTSGMSISIHLNRRGALTVDVFVDERHRFEPLIIRKNELVVQVLQATS